MTDATDETLHIAEIPYETGELRFRFARRRSRDGQAWIREGLFQEFFRNGRLASEGLFKDDREDGHWREFYENGELAAEGDYRDGKEQGRWLYWDEDGNPEESVAYLDGEEIPDHP
jgi:antitoxin component YwqK of YwqJK toxin-antitoxin module